MARYGHVERVISGHYHRTIHARFAGTIASVCPSSAHQLLLDLVPGADIGFTFEPSGFPVASVERQRTGDARAGGRRLPDVGVEGLSHADGQVPQLRRRESGQVPALRLLRHAAGAGRGGAAAAGTAQDRHAALHRPEGLDRPRRDARQRGDARGQGALLRGDVRRDRAARRQDREVHRRRDHGGVRAAAFARGRRVAGGAGRCRHAEDPGKAEQGPAGALRLSS